MSQLLRVSGSTSLEVNASLNPRHSCTGSRGYLGNEGSSADRRHRVEAGSPCADDDLRVLAALAQTDLVVVYLLGPVAIVHHARYVHVGGHHARGSSPRRVRVLRRIDLNPDKNQWFFLYTVTISNESADTLQLLTRHWIITDGTGHIEEVRGPGVVGKQPTLTPR